MKETLEMYREREDRESLFTTTKQKHNSKPILHKLGGLPEGHTPITADYPLLTSAKHSTIQLEQKNKKKENKEKKT